MVILEYIGNLKPALATGDPVSKGLEGEERLCGSTQEHSRLPEDPHKCSKDEWPLGVGPLGDTKSVRRYHRGLPSWFGAAILRTERRALLRKVTSGPWAFLPLDAKESVIVCMDGAAKLQMSSKVVQVRGGVSGRASPRGWLLLETFGGFLLFFFFPDIFF